MTLLTILRIVTVSSDTHQYQYPTQRQADGVDPAPFSTIMIRILRFWAFLVSFRRLYGTNILSSTWEDKCTTIAIGKAATSDGSTVCTDTMVSNEV